MIEICRYAQFHQKMTFATQTIINAINQQDIYNAATGYSNAVTQDVINKMPDILQDVMAPYNTNTAYIFISSIQQNSPPTAPFPAGSTDWTNGGCAASSQYSGGNYCAADVMWQVAPDGQGGANVSKISPLGGCTYVTPTTPTATFTKYPQGIDMEGDTSTPCPTIKILPNGVNLQTILVQNSQVIIGEVYMKYTPLLSIPGLSKAIGTILPFEVVAPRYNYKYAFATPRYGAFQNPPTGSTPIR